MRHGLLALAGLALTLACGRDKPSGDATPDAAPAPARAEDGGEPEVVVIDPRDVAPLDVLYFPEPVGEGYAKVGVEFGEVLYSGKWLGLANGEAEFLGPNRIIVNHFRGPTRNPFTGDIAKSVLLDFETGDVVAEFRRATYAQWYWGLAIVFIDDDDRPYLLDAETGELTLAIPDGKHEYTFGENYWIRFSPIAKRVWIYAIDKKDDVHLYEWSNRSRPPNRPNNPFPFFPDDWDPEASTRLNDADTDEVRTRRLDQECTRAVLLPPTGHVCLDDQGLEDTEPLSGHWRVDRENGRVINSETGVAHSFSALCPATEDVYATRLRRSPASAELVCEREASTLLLWTPEAVRRVPAAHAPAVRAGELRLMYHDEADRYELRGPDEPNTNTVFDQSRLVREVVGSDYDCESPEPRPGNRLVFGTACKHSDGRVAWLDVVDAERKVRARFKAADMAISRTGSVVVILRRGENDLIVPLRLKRT